MGKLLRLTEKLYNTPHLMLPASLERVFNFLDDRNNAPQMAIDFEKKPKERDIQYVAETNTGVIPVHGPLTYIEYAAMCGEQNSSYQQVKSDFDNLLKMGAKRIILDVDSPGGEAYGMMETGRYMRMKADEKGVSLLAYVDGLSASAAYGLSCAAHEIVINQDAEAGSVGVVVRLRNTNEAMKKMGVQDTYIYAGDSKIPFDAEGGFREDFLNDIQYKVDTLYQQFSEYVAEMRGIDVGVVKNTQARVLIAKDAADIGLADKVMSREEFYNYVADLVETGGKPMPLSFQSKEVKTKMTDVTQEAFAEMQTQLQEVLASLEDTKAALSAANEQKEQAAALLAEMQAKAEASAKEAAELKAAVDKAKDDARMEALKEVTTDEEAVELFKSTKALDDAAFAVILKSLKAANAKEEEIFKEKGVSNSQATVEDVDPVRRALLAKYHSQNK